MEKYFVIGPDGNQYGPADIATLLDWKNQGRVQPNTMLAPELGGNPIPASMVPALGFAAPAASSPGYAPGYSAPSADTPAAGPGAAPASWGQQPSNYPRGPMMGTQVMPSGFNWGAFWFSWIWGLNHRKPILLVLIAVSLVPLVGPLLSFGGQIYAGLNGNKWAWESGRFATVDDCLACQRIWRTWALAFIGVTIVLVIIALATGALLGTTSAVSPEIGG